MSSWGYPTNLPGLKFDSERTPIFRTGVQSAVSFKESRLSYALFPVFEFSLQYELLRHDTTPSDLRNIVGFFGEHRGRWDTFLYNDPTYNTVVDEPFGVGDGVTTQFQLVAKFGNATSYALTELIQNLGAAPTIKKAGVTQTVTTHYTISGTGVVTFVTAPAAAEALTWSGSFYYRCRFVDDHLTTTEFMNKLWATKQVKLRSIKL